MKIIVEKPGLQTTIQGRPRHGRRYLGIPASGPADRLSMALANHLVGNAALTPALETTLTGLTIKFTGDAYVAITGASTRCTLNNDAVELHRRIAVQRDDVLHVGAAEKGVRSYIAFAGGLEADDMFGSVSTYMPAAFGGHEGRAIEKGDEISLPGAASVAAPSATPSEFQPPMPDAWTLRAGRSAETSSLSNPERLFEQRFKVSNRSDRMGIKLEGEAFATNSDGQMLSSPVFPGTIQCTQDGGLFILSVDAGTTGGYPRVAKITRMDLHLLGQLRPGNSITLIERIDADAALELRQKHAYWQRWLPDIAAVI